MGMRSQIYVRIQDTNTKEALLVARYFQNNFGEEMVSRVRHTIDWINENIRHIDCSSISIGDSFMMKQFLLRLPHIIETDFDYVDYYKSSDIIAEWKDFGNEETFEDFGFIGQDNNDGQAFIDVRLSCFPEIRYCFSKDSNGDKPLNAIEYLKWDRGEEEAEELLSPSDNTEREDAFDVASKLQKNIEVLSDYKMLTFGEMQEIRRDTYLNLQEDWVEPKWA